MNDSPIIQLRSGRPVRDDKDDACPGFVPLLSRSAGRSSWQQGLGGLAGRARSAIAGLASKKTLLSIAAAPRSPAAVVAILSLAVVGAGLNFAPWKRVGGGAKPGARFLPIPALGRTAETARGRSEWRDSVAMFFHANAGLTPARTISDDVAAASRALADAKKRGEAVPPAQKRDEAGGVDLAALAAQFEKRFGAGAAANGAGTRKLERVSLGSPSATSASSGGGHLAFGAGTGSGRAAAAGKLGDASSQGSRPVIGRSGRPVQPGRGGAYSQLLASNQLSRGGARAPGSEPASYQAQRAFDGESIKGGGTPIEGGGAALGGAGPSIGTSNESSMPGGSYSGPLSEQGSPDTETDAQECAQPPCDTPAEPEPVNVTPYQTMLDLAIILLLAATALLMLAYALQAYPVVAKVLKIAAVVLAVIAAGIGLWILASYGQYLQGSILITAGAMIAALGLMP